MYHSSPALRRLLLATATGVGLFACVGAAGAVTPAEMIVKAKAACLESAGKQGWRTEIAEVVSARALDNDKVEAVFLLTKDGVSKARLTCPFSLSQGVLGDFGGVLPGVALPDAPAMPQVPAIPVDRNRAWWLLLPLGLALASWAALRGRTEALATGYGRSAPATYGSTGATGTPYATTGTGGRHIFVEANAHDGQLEVREHANPSSLVLRRVRNSESVELTGHRQGDWLEVAGGGWVRDQDVRYDRGVVRFS